VRVAPRRHARRRVVQQLDRDRPRERARAFFFRKRARGARASDAARADWFGVWQSAASTRPAPRPQAKFAAPVAGASRERRSNAAKRTADRGPAKTIHGAAPA